MTLDPHAELDAESAMEAKVADLQPQLDTFDGLVDWWTTAAADFPGGDDWQIIHSDGPTEGVGLEVQFQVAGMTTETWTLLSTEPGKVVWNVDFGVFQVERTFGLVAEGEGTHMTWHEEAEFGHPLARWFTLMDNQPQLDNFAIAMKGLDRSALD